MPINYSKWDNIELSDDEDNFHPNIDNNLMIRLQREKREQREAEEAEKRKQLEKEGTIESKGELSRLDRMQKLHVGNICQDKFNSKHEKSAASSSADPSKAAKDTKLKVGATDEGQFMEGYEDFLAKNQVHLDTYAEIDEDDDKSQAYILENTDLLSEHATGYYLLHCINLQAEGKTRQMRKTARQYLLLTYVCDLAKTMPGRDARDAIKPLFHKMAHSHETHEAFSEHLEKYIAHVKTRAEVKKEETLKEAAEAAGSEEGVEYVPIKKGEQTGPGGLDPAEVFETLPAELQEAFGERDTDALKRVLMAMDGEDAKHHMQRCIDSGLWDPSGGSGVAGADEDDGVPSAEIDED